MAVELVMDYGFTGNVSTANTAATMAEESALEEAASAGIRSMEKLIKLLSHQHRYQQKLEEKLEEKGEMEPDCMAMADAAVNKFRKVISLLGRTRTGHARFRRAPLLSQPVPLEETKKESEVEKGEEPVRVYCPKPIQRLPPLPHHHHQPRIVTPSPPVSAINSYATSVMTGETSLSTGFQISASRPPLSTTTSVLKRKCGSKSEDGAGKCTGGGATGRCHCSKRRKHRVKRTVRVPAISLKMADIPSDDFSWRKYGQKPIKGSPHPRGYYKCSSVRGCPARKHVERAVDDPTMLVITYEGDHNHTHESAPTLNPPPRAHLPVSS